MKKLVLGLALALSASFASAAAPVFPTLVNAPGETQVKTGATNLISIVVGTVAPDGAFIQVYDSASLLTTAASLKFVIPMAATVTQTASRSIPINAYFANGVVVCSNALTSTLTATLMTVPAN